MAWGSPGSRSGCHRPRAVHRGNLGTDSGVSAAGGPECPEACGAVDLGVTTQQHHIAPAGSTFELGDQVLAREGAIHQQHDRAESGQELVHLLQQSDRHRGADAGTGMLKHLPELRDRPALSYPDTAPPRRSGSTASWFRAPVQGMAWSRTEGLWSRSALAAATGSCRAGCLSGKSGWSCI